MTARQSCTCQCDADIISSLRLRDLKPPSTASSWNSPLISSPLCSSFISSPLLCCLQMSCHGYGYWAFDGQPGGSAKRHPPKRQGPRPKIVLDPAPQKSS
ncbi:hypothetical protein DPX16_20050 [Anabarilius grahami]|uniref:Uncharacterized protein n=1 Tax=Anabarilius grahami TaxID=495550 RepID=A0A3N0XS93_ANAGA|nr:hypothetical protein DPX16_20050 [Anabarilius grahami]